MMDQFHNSVQYSKVAWLVAELGRPKFQIGLWRQGALQVPRYLDICLEHKKSPDGPASDGLSSPVSCTSKWPTRWLIEMVEMLDF